MPASKAAGHQRGISRCLNSTHRKDLCDRQERYRSIAWLPAGRCGRPRRRRRRGSRPPAAGQRGRLPPRPGPLAGRRGAAAALAAGPPDRRRAGPAGDHAVRLPARPAVLRLEEVPVRHRLQCQRLGILRSDRLHAPAASSRCWCSGTWASRAAAARAGHRHGGRALRPDAAPRGDPLARRAGRRAGPARRLPAERGTDDHARRAVRGAGGSRDRAAAVESPARAGLRRAGRLRVRHVRAGPPGRRGADPARAGLRAGGGPGLAHPAAARRGAGGVLRAAHRGLHGLLQGDPALRLRDVQHGRRVPVRPDGACRRLRHAEAPRGRTAAVPDPGAGRHARRRRAGQQPGLTTGAIRRRSTSGRHRGRHRSRCSASSPTR